MQSDWAQQGKKGYKQDSLNWDLNPLLESGRRLELEEGNMLTLIKKRIVASVGKGVIKHERSAKSIWLTILTRG